MSRPEAKWRWDEDDGSLLGERGQVIWPAAKIVRRLPWPVIDASPEAKRVLPYAPNLIDVVRKFAASTGAQDHAVALGEACALLAAIDGEVNGD